MEFDEEVGLEGVRDFVAGEEDLGHGEELTVLFFYLERNVMFGSEMNVLTLEGGFRECDPVSRS